MNAQVAWHQATRALAAATLLCLASSISGPALAGRPCEPEPASTEAVTQGLALAEATRQHLDDSGEQVVIIARAGQDLSSWGLRWSHLAFAYRDGDGARSHWRVVHKLNHCGTPQAELYRQGLGPFFLDQPFRYEAAVVALSPEVQARLLPILSDNRAATRMHQPRYNMLAYPWSTRYQQSNQWALETLASAMDPDARTRPQAQAWLRLRGYQPTRLRIGALTRLGANLTSANIAFDDHPNEQRFADRIDTVTVESVFEWLNRSGLGTEPAIVSSR